MTTTTAATTTAELIILFNHILSMMNRLEKRIDSLETTDGGKF